MIILKGMIAILFIAANTLIWCVPIYVLAVPKALIPVRRIRVSIGAGMTRVIDAWVAGNRFMLSALSITKINVTMDVDEPLARDRWYVVICNHQGWSDILVLQDTFLGRIPPLKFFVKQQLIWIPFLGFAMWLLGFPYVRRYSREVLARDPTLRRHDQQATQRASEAFKSRPTSVLNFMEGTRFSPEKHAYQQSKYRNLLMPKSGGFGYVVAALGDRIHQVLDVTIVYPHGTPSFWEFISGRCPEVRVEISSRDAPAELLAGHEDLPTPAREALHSWIDELWSRKDQRIEDLRNSRHVQFD
jgi:1-acyl-sn-glycerol-3-phosphate acyltransferase